MKRNIFFLCLTALLMITHACQHPLEEVVVGFKNPIEEGIVEIRFRSLKGEAPNAIKLAIAGSDADKVVTTLNTDNYKVNEDGVLILAASPIANYSKTDPLTFTVAARADGYLDILQPVQLADTGRHFLSPAWIKLSDPPAHLSATKLSEIKGDFAADLPIGTPIINQKKDNVTITATQGSTLMDANGTALDGPFTAALLHIENRGNATANYLPTGSTMSAVRASDGENLGSMQLSQLAGAFFLEFYNDQFSVARQISKPVSCVMSLNSETINPTKGRPIQPGDEIPFYRYDRFSAQWYQEKPGLITRHASTGQLECKINISHLSLWVAGWTKAVCDEGPVFTVSSKLNQTDIRYLCKVVDADTGEELNSFYTFLNNGDRIVLTHLPQNRKVRLLVYNYNESYSTGDVGKPVLETAPLQTCNRTPGLLELQKLPIPPSILVSFDFVCPPPTKLNEAMLPAKIRLQYSESGKRKWSDLVTLNRNSTKAISYKLQIKRPYDIRISTDGGATWSLEKNRFIPDNNNLAFEISSPNFCK